MRRRHFLKGVLGTGGLAGGQLLFGNPLLRRASAQVPTTPTLVVIFQRGGCDGLNAVIPYGDTNYAALRPTIGVAPPDPNNPESALALGDPSALGNQPADFFGLHPSLSPLMDIYDAGDLAVLPTVQYNNATRSHFSGQHRIESGAPRDDIDGWLNRHLQSAGISSQLQAVGFGGELAQALRGNIPVQSFSFIDAFTLGLGDTDETLLTGTVTPVYNDVPDPASDYQLLVHQYGQVLFNNLSVVNSIDTSSYVPENGAVYPGSGYGRQLREIAQLIKAGVGLEVATVDIGGWDTHSTQGGGEANGRQARRFADFAGGIRALYQDLGTMMDDVVILTMTEFGRTSRENGSAGTDHGNAAAWFAAGRRLTGGVYGAWPGLDETNELYQGRYLQHTVDFRDVMGDILVNLFGHGTGELATLLPGHAYSPMNLFQAPTVAA